VQQYELWKDGYAILQREDTGAIGHVRLKRFLQWLDANGYGWQTPHLDEYAEHLRTTRDLNEKTIDDNLMALRMHYLAILSNPENYDHIPPDKRATFVNRMVERLGYNPVSIRYTHLVRDDDSIGSQNMKALMGDEVYATRVTRLRSFVHWLDRTGRTWHEADLLEYKHYMREQGRNKEYINNLLHSLRKRYHEIAEDETVLALLDDETREDFLTNLRRRLGYIDSYPNRTEASREMVEDDPYNKNWLSVLQERALIQQPDPDTLIGLRDRAMIALVLTTAVQQFEVARVQVSDLRHDKDGDCALYVAESKTREPRLVPYDDTYPVLEWIDAWLEKVNITEGPVFRGTYGNTTALRPHAIKPETAGDILARYPIVINGHPVSLFFSDLRSTCARRWYRDGVPLDEIAERAGLTHWSMLSLVGLRLRDIYQ
jgi:site-specific recombinase XerD